MLLVLRFVSWITNAKKKQKYKFQVQKLTETSLNKTYRVVLSLEFLQKVIHDANILGFNFQLQHSYGS
jgi:hypothetical protein